MPTHNRRSVRPQKTVKSGSLEDKWETMLSGDSRSTSERKRPGSNKAKLPALLRAAEQGDVSTIKELVQAGAKLDEKASPKMAFYHGADALILAARHGHIDAVRVLLQLGANATTEAGYGSALEEAAANGHATVVGILLKNGARNFGYGLFSAGAQGYLDVFREVVKAGIPLAGFRSRHGDSLLEYVIQQKKDNVAKFLLHAGVKPGDGGPLAESAARGSVELIRLLIERGADPNQVNRMRRYPLGVACSRGHRKVAEILIEHGADLTLIDVRGWSCIDWAKHGQHQTLVSWLEFLAKSKGLKISKKP